MPKTFVTLTKESFIQWANSTFGENNYQITRPKNGREVVIRHDLKVHGLEFHCYTTIEPEIAISRAKGEDAIRSVLYDRFAGLAIHHEPKVLRVEGDTAVLDRLTERVNNIKRIADTLQKQNRFCKCKENRVFTVKRTNTKTGEQFFGCSIWHLCKNSTFNKLKNAQQQYPLADNPFGVQKIATAESIPTVYIPKDLQTTPKKPNTPHKTWEVNLEKELVATQQWPYIKYPFDHFNYVQSTVYNSQAWNRDCNLILGTATSSGKTICAEMIIATLLYGNQ